MKLQKNALEWTVFGLSLLLVTATLVFLVATAAHDRNLPPDIRLALGPVEARGGRYAVPVTAVNLGDQTAADVAIEIVLGQTEAPVERAEITFSFLPRRSEQTGWVTFTTDPKTVGRIEPHVLGYVTP